MEQWEAIIERPLEEGHRSFEKLLQTASAILNTAATHLAPFETEWLMETLLYTPVDLLGTVAQQRGDEAWSKALVDALKLLTTAVDAGVCTYKHYDHIADLCLLSYDAEVRKHALACLASVARRSDAGARDAARHVAALGDASQCRAPLALLVGALCEHHPAVLCDEVTNVWRGFLNMLENTKNTDTVTKAVLEGILGLLKHFGDELPTTELGQLYDRLAHVYISKPPCQPACFNILREHAALFRERLAGDRVLRASLWASAPAAGAVASVYAVVAQCVDTTTLKKILTTEVLPHTQSPIHQVKLTALRVLAASKTDSFGDLTQFVDVYTLEYELRRERVSHADAEFVLWCVEYNLQNSERLLQAAILFYDNLPTAFRRKIVVAGILNSPPEVRQAAIQFLISHCCEDADANVWRDLNEDDVMSQVARELADCLATALEAVSDDEFEELPSKLTSLLHLTGRVSRAHGSALGACAPLLRARSPAALAAALAAARAVLPGAAVEDTIAFYKSISLAGCRDEAALHEASLTLARAPDDVDVAPGDMLWALQIIFSSDVDPKIQCAALAKFDILLSNNKCLDADTYDTIRAVEKLRTRGDRTDKEIRILHREITMFLGKHGNVDANDNRDGFDDAVVADLRKSLALTLPCQGTSYKVDLKTLLLLALHHEDPGTLQTLLAMLCANLSSNKELSTQRAIVRVVRALASAHASGCGAHTPAVQRAVRLCGDAACCADMLQYISSTRSCGVRKLLSTALSALCEDPAILQLTADRTAVMLSSSESTTKRAGLDISETIIASLENNNYLSKTIIPELIVSIAKTHESDTKTTFDIASKTFIDKQELFDKETIRKTIRSLLEYLLKSNLSDVKIYKISVKMTIEFIKNLRDFKLDESLEAIFDISEDVDVKLLYVLAVLKSEFGFDNELSRKILERENSALLNYLLNLRFEQTELQYFEVEVGLKFLEEYCAVVLELNYKESVQFISELITKFTPVLLKQLQKSIKLCFTSLNKHWKDMPKPITSSIQTWVEMLPIKKITEAIDRESFLPEHKQCVDALKIMSNVFDIRQIILSDVKLYIRRWPKILLNLYSSGRLEDYCSSETPYFIAILTVSSKFLTGDDVKKILKGSFDSSNKGILFCGFFMQGFFEVLTEKPFILLNEDLKECSVILIDVVRLVVKKPSLKEWIGNVLELVDKLWPSYEQHATFAQKHCLLASLECLGPRPESNPLQWATRTVCARDAALDHRVKLLAYVPEEAFKCAEVGGAAPALAPARARELRPALLQAAAARPAALLPALAALAANDSTAGWWDAALEACLAAAAARSPLDTCGALFSKCQSERTCERVLVPLLRHSSAEVCERFLAPILDKVLGALNRTPKGDAAHAGHEKRWEEYMISLHLLLLAFEKLPTWSLESPSSALYSCSPAAPPWHLVRSGCKLCHSLREAVRCPPEAGDRLQAKYRKLQCMLYNCLCAGVCRRRAGAALYAQLFGAAALARLADARAHYHLPIRPSWAQRNKPLPVAVPLEPTSLSLSRTQRSRIFLRTLSEDPMLFDLHSPYEEAVEVQDISLRETPLNAHPCAATLTALFRHAAGAPALAPHWHAVAAALRDAHRNLQWLLAQIICNCRDELKPQASVLLPALLAVLTRTGDANGVMNGLHIDVLDTILYWKEDINEDLNTVARNLLVTCMEHRRRKSVFDGLLKTLHGLLELYGSSIQIEWKSLEPYYEDQHKDTQKALLQLVKLICKSKIYVPQILSKIVAKMDTDPSKMAECFGLAMAVCQDGGEKGTALAAFKKYLEKCTVITSYVRVLYYASLGSAECCGDQEFRKITDYVTKVTSQDRTKCLHVLSAYLSRGRRGELVADMFDTVDLSDMIAKDQTALLLVRHGLPAMSEALRRRCVAQLAALGPAPRGRRLVVDAMLRAGEELFAQPAQPPAKRQKTESTPILSVSRDDSYCNSVLTCLGLGAVDTDAEVARVARDALGAKMAKDLGARFAECFLLSVYLPAHSDRAPGVCACVSALLDMLYSDVRAAESFKNYRLRDEPLVVRDEGVSKLLTLSKSFQGTFSRYSAARGRLRPTPDTDKPAIDVQVTIDSILGTLLEFAKTTPEAARALLTEVLRSVLSSSKFDLASSLVPLLGSLLGRQPTELTPLYIDLCRVLVASGSWSVQSLLGPVERLRARTAGTEGAGLARLLHEEVNMRAIGDKIFQLGNPDDVEDVAMDDTAAFSIEDLKSAFGKLSDWDDLTLQQRRSVKNSALPALWTDRADFVARLDSYEVPADAQCWFDKMAAAFKQETGPHSVRWLRKMDQWPRRHFEISAITEATSWRHEATESPPSHLFKTGDCLAEWAARLMIRSSYYNSLQHSATDEDRMAKLSRSHELKWCVRANEMEIPEIALQCVNRNVGELCESEALPWLRQQLLALRLRARGRRDAALLRDALRKAEKYTPKYSTDPSMSIEMYHLTLLLHGDLKTLTHDVLQTILAKVERSSQEVDWSVSSNQAVSAVYEIAMSHYDEALETGAVDIDIALQAMSLAFCRAAALRVRSADMLLAMLLRRLDDGPALAPDTGRQLVEQLAPLVSSLDAFTLELLQRNSSKLGARLRALLPRDEGSEKYRRCLQLVCDPNHLLHHYCEDLVLAVRAKDGALWKSIHDRMRDKIYENPYAGPSFKLLDKFKADLYGMYQYEPTAEFASQAEAKLKSIMAAVRKEPQPTLHLADLCPALRGDLEATGVAKWFGLRGVRVVKLYDKVQVFTDSIRRPVVVSALLSDGSTRRALLKTGERLARDAAAQRVAACAQRRAGGGAAYRVTLLDEESALIEYLEGHERLRSLIASTCDLDEVLQSASRPADRSLAEAPAASLLAHAQLCARVPATALRTAVEQNSSCIQDFICKKRNFTDSLADMAILTWLLGLGDRHLQNVLCSRDMRARSVDWADVLRRGAEPPARLTRTLLALADRQVLEARLQRALGALRAAGPLLAAVAWAAFRGLEPALGEQLQYVNGILRGVTSSYRVTRDVIARGDNLRHKDKYLELLDRVFADFPDRDHYSVEDQVSCLLRHCTSPEVLSVTRAGWEPWV